MEVPNQLYCYLAKLKRVVDGDTIYLEVDHGFYTYSIRNVRLARINTPEIRGKEKPKGLISKAFVEDILANCEQIILQSFKVDNFGRSIGEIWVDKVNLSDLLVEKNLAEYKAY